MVKAGFFYFLIVFAVGFALGTVRVLFVVPRIGEGTAELLEQPVMIIASFVTARFVVRRFTIDNGSHALAAGLFALLLLIFFELTLVLGLRGLSLSEYIESREAVPFVAYLASVLLFGLMPFLVMAIGKRSRRSE